MGQIIKGSNGFLALVTSEEVLDAEKKFCIRDELLEKGFKLSKTENATFIGFAGLVKKVLSGEVPKGSAVLLMLTGKGIRRNFSLYKPDLETEPKLHESKYIFDALKY